MADEDRICKQCGKDLTNESVYILHLSLGEIGPLCLKCRNKVMDKYDGKTLTTKAKTKKAE